MYLTKDKSSPYYQVIYFNSEGKRTRISTRSKKKSDALKFLANFKNRPETVVQKELIKLKAFKLEYLAYLKPIKSKHYIRSVELSFKQLISFLGKDVYISEITTRTLDKFLSTVYARAKSASHLYYRTLKTSFNKAIAWEYLERNPFDKIKPAKVEEKLPRFLTEPDLLKVLNNTSKQVLRDAFTFAFYTGMRQAEISNLRWDAVDMTNRMIIVANTKSFTTKSKKERLIPICDRIFEILSRRLPKVNQINKPDYVFKKYEGVKLGCDYLSKQFKKAVRASNINHDFKFHDLRHSFASGLVQKNVSLYVVKELLGHQDIKTTQIYSHIQQETLRNAVNLLD